EQLDWGPRRRSSQREGCGEAPVAYSSRRRRMYFLSLPAQDRLISGGVEAGARLEAAVHSLASFFGSLFPLSVHSTDQPLRQVSSGRFFESSAKLHVANVPPRRTAPATPGATPSEQGSSRARS